MRSDNLPLPWFPAIMYHRVVDSFQGPDPYALNLTAEQLDGQLRYLKEKGYQSVSPLDAIAIATGQRERPAFKPVVLTFDDGYMDFMTHALPLLREHGFTAMVMLISDRIGGRNEWDEGRAPQTGLMGEAEIREAAAAGILFGSHSLTHPHLAGLDPETARAEVADSKKSLEDLLGTRVDIFCYPYGNSSPAVRDAVVEAGYAAAFGIEQRQHELFNVSRVDGVRNAGTGLKWRFHISGRHFRLRNRTFRVRRLMRRLRP